MPVALPAGATSVPALSSPGTGFGVHTSYAKENKNGTYSYEPVLTTAARWDAGKVYDQIISMPGPACGLS